MRLDPVDGLCEVAINDIEILRPVLEPLQFLVAV